MSSTYRFQRERRTEVTLFDLDGVRARTGAKGTRFFRREIASGRGDLKKLAKGAADRDLVRTAIGQLADYLFHIAKDGSFGPAPAPAILLPQRPNASIIALLEHLNIAVIWRRGDYFEDNQSGAFT